MYIKELLIRANSLYMEIFNICEVSTAMTTHSNLSFFASRNAHHNQSSSFISRTDDNDNDHNHLGTELHHHRHQDLAEHNFKVNNIVANLQGVCDRERSGTDNVAMISLLPSSGKNLLCCSTLH